MKSLQAEVSHTTGPLSSVFGLLLCAVLAAGSPQGVRGDDRSDAGKVLLQICEDYWEYYLRRHPERATYLGDHRYNDKLFDYSGRAREEELRTYRALLDRTERVAAEKLTPEDRLNLELFTWMLRSELDKAAFPEHLLPVDHLGGPHQQLGVLYASHPFDTPKDCANYAARLRGFARQVADVISLLNEGVRRGVVQPRLSIERVLPQIDAMVTDDPRESLLYAPAKSLPKTADGAESQKLIEEAAWDAVSALRRLREYMRESYLPKCRETVGFCALPDGRAWYKQLAKHHITTDLTPEQIHQIGLDELKRIHQRMRAVGTELGFGGDVRTLIEEFRGDKARHNQSGDVILRRHAEILDRVNRRLPELFGTLPKTRCQVKEMELVRAIGGPAAYYYEAPDDDSRPAYFVVNTTEPRTRPVYTMEALAYHEALPGHHLQGAIIQERRGLPNFRRFGGIDAYIEGWALYAELLGYELGGYQDVDSRFGQLTFAAWRAARLVVDTGIHHYGWPRQRAVDFMKENTALSEHDIEAEVDRYIAWPGQALAYLLGQIEILELRREAEAALDGRFDIRAFHDHLLAEGSMPLSMLRQRMTDWVAACQADRPGPTSQPTATAPDIPDRPH